MMIKVYWACRLIGYVACLAGIFLYLRHQGDADPARLLTGLGLVGAGFVAFFISYALRAWLRFGLRRGERQVP